MRPYNPLDRVELGKSVERALLARPLVSLDGFLARNPKHQPELRYPKFPGAGLYALYYRGTLACYAKIALPVPPDRQIPIYVGRARPKGARQGALGLSSTSDGPVLFQRLREHARSILAAHEPNVSGDTRSLSILDFTCRYLVADEIWVPLGEALLIGRYRPVWNVVVDGFGNHHQGSGRDKQAQSLWDTLHPGRSFAKRLPPSASTAREIEARVVRHLAETESPDLDRTPSIDDEVMRALNQERD
ncbi:Eco29kI restriction endonuclease [Asanoa hainanensis]|uniref:Eco29kI restriction endonuclease n=2 Tax=Asanoa hainanensis TaxID=560556 RepID=A0A239MSP0_9ACTN|nr:Eco29kI restriction endonuclease [Asanoa hainanensis]